MQDNELTWPSWPQSDMQVWMLLMMGPPQEGCRGCRRLSSLECLPRCCWLLLQPASREQMRSLMFSNQSLHGDIIRNAQIQGRARSQQTERGQQKCTLRSQNNAAQNMQAAAST